MTMLSRNTSDTAPTGKTKSDGRLAVYNMDERTAGHGHTRVLPPGTLLSEAQPRRNVP